MKQELICVKCGKPWKPLENTCECGAFCAWGYEIGKPLSWDINEGGKWTPKPVDISLNEDLTEDELL